MRIFRNFLLIAILLCAANELFAQTIPNGGDVRTHFTSGDIWDNHEFSIDITQKGNSLKILYAYCDSVNRGEILKDTLYEGIRNRVHTYETYSLKRKLAEDTIEKIFEKHSVSTRSSAKVNLKKDTAYGNLIERVINASKDEISPDINANAKATGIFIVVADGHFAHLTIITPTGKRSIPINAPPINSPLLINFIRSTFDKNQNSSAVKKIRKVYPELK